MRARSTGIYHHQNENEPLLNGLPKLNVDTTSLENKCVASSAKIKKLESITEGIEHIKIRYEDFADWKNTMQRITTFLNVSAQELPEGAVAHSIKISATNGRENSDGGR